MYRHSRRAQAARLRQPDLVFLQVIPPNVGLCAICLELITRTRYRLMRPRALRWAHIFSHLLPSSLVPSKSDLPNVQTEVQSTLIKYI